MQKHHSRQSGFTLIELSIVLVIIGLIVGGVLVGQDLIRAAEIRATISQIEKYNTAVNTFRGKYNGVPGDLTNPGTFGFATRTGAAGRGDGNGLVEACAAGAQTYGCETALFWNDLSTASLVDGSFTGVDGGPTAVASTGLSAFLPAAKLGRGNLIHVFSNNGYNYYFLGLITSTTSTDIINAAGLSPNQAYSIDKKVDDGQPTTGTVAIITPGTSGATGMTSHLFVNPTTGSSSTCANASTPPSYNLITTYADSLLCDIQMRFN